MNYIIYEATGDTVSRQQPRVGLLPISYFSSAFNVMAVGK